MAKIKLNFNLFAPIAVINGVKKTTTIRNYTPSKLRINVGDTFEYSHTINVDKHFVTETHFFQITKIEKIFYDEITDEIALNDGFLDAEMLQSFLATTYGVRGHQPLLLFTYKHTGCTNASD